MKKCILLMTIILCAPFGSMAQNILINQVGHRPQDRKDFRLSTEAAGFEILDRNGAVVHEGDIVKQNRQDDGALEDVWIGDFSSFNEEGTYTIKLDNGQQSDSFSIQRDLYNEVFRTAVRGLYVTRCTYAVQDDSVGHGVCHQDVGKSIYRKEGSEEFFLPADKDVAGGWHNGGDYRRSTLSAAQAINRMLTTVELSPDKFQRYPSTLAPGEGRGGWPDIVVEAKWGLDWLVKMQDDEGGMHLGLGPGGLKNSDNKHPRYDTPPESDDTDYFIGTVEAANTGKAGAVLAQAARVFENYDATLASSYLERAKRAYDFLSEKGGVSGGGTIFTYRFNGGWVKDFLWLSLELYLTTQDAQYHDKFVELYNRIVNESGGASFPTESVGTHTMRSENLHETLLRYCLIKDLETNDQIKGQIWEGARDELNPLVEQWRDMGYGYVLPKEFWTHRHTVGNMLHKAWTLLTAYRVSKQIEPFPLNGYRDAALDQVNILLGRNALNQTFVTGVGHRFVTDPHLRLTSLGGVPPGMPVKGPTYDEGFREHQKEQANQTVAAAPAKNYIDQVTKHWVNEPDVEATGYFIAFTGYLASDGGDASSPEPPAEVRLVSPSAGERFDQEASITLRVEVADPDNTEKIEFFRNDTIKLGSANDEYTFVWHNIAAGEQRFTARLTDRAGNMVTSEVVTVTVSESSDQPGQLLIRAKGDCGEETMELRIDGEPVQRWDNLSTSFSDYTYEGFAGGDVAIHFINDRFDPNNAGCPDRNLTIDYVAACGVLYQTEEVAAETANCCLDFPETLYTHGDFNFGRLSCSASPASRSEAKGTQYTDEVLVYPNPAQEQVIIQGPEHYDVTLYNLHGKTVKHQAQQSGACRLDVATVPSGVYLLRTVDTDHQRTSQNKLVIE